MRVSRYIPALLAMVALSNYSLAEIYETRDAEGKTVFTDVPNEDAKAVDLQPINTADAPPDIPHTATPDQPPHKASGTAAAQQGQEEGVTIIGDAHNDRVERAVEEHRRDEVRDALENTDGDHVEHRGEAGHKELLKRTPPAAQPHVGGHRR